MKEYKIRQEMYHKLNTEFDDDLSNFDIKYNEDTIIEDCITYMTKPSSETGWMYPAKSYLVAMAYASWLVKDFNEDYYELLNDPDLLYGNDPYFKTYKEDPKIYDKLIELYGTDIPMVNIIVDIKQYYLDEFMIELETDNPAVL